MATELNQQNFQLLCEAVQTNLVNVTELINQTSGGIQARVAQSWSEAVSPGGTIFQINAKLDHLDKELSALKANNMASRGWNIKDPKMRGTSKYAGDKKDDVRAFPQ